MRSALAILLLLACFVAACADSPTTPAVSQSITSGSSFGECWGFCFQEVTFRGAFAFYLKRDFGSGEVVSGKTYWVQGRSSALTLIGPTAEDDDVAYAAQDAIFPAP